MSRQARATAKKSGALLLTVLMALTGCHPTQPFYLFEDGDLSHYIDAATTIDYPDVHEMALAEAEQTKEPLTLINPHFDEFWDLTLEEAICITLKNSKVIRSLGIGQSTTLRSLADVIPDRLLSGQSVNGAANANTVYDPALVEANPGSIGLSTGPDNLLGTRAHGSRSSPGSVGTGVAGPEAALAAFDARLSAGMTWQRVDQPQNAQGVGEQFLASQSDTIRNHIQLSKRTATGGEFFMRTNANYQQSSSGIRAQPSDWQANLELEARHHILRGAGAQVNRANVIIGRLNTDISLAEFEKSVRNLVFDVERAYWDLYFQYRNLESQKTARDSALVSWKKVKTKAIVSVPGGEAEKEAQARQQYFRFRSQVETALRDTFKVENRLRYIMGLTASDGRMIRPADEPVTVAIQFDWNEILCESLFRSVELRQQKWRIKQRDMELILARNGLLPRLDVAALYRWLGVGDDLIEANRNGLNFPAAGSLAWDELTEGNYQEVSFGIVGEMPIGFRQELSGVRYAQLNMAREKAVLAEMELELSHALTAAYQDLQAWYQLVQTNYNWRVAAQKEVDAVEAAYEAGTVTLDLLLRAQQSRADAETAYYQALQQYNLAIASVHFRKGSLLEYDGVCLAEGGWPEKAYFDALGHARRRDASLYLNYGFTRPGVISRGPVDQMSSGAGMPEEFVIPSPDGTASPIEDIELGPETLEVPPNPVPEEIDLDGNPVRVTPETATRPEGPQLMPPLLHSAFAPDHGARPRDAEAFDWGVVASRLVAAPLRTAEPQSAVVPASHETSRGGAAVAISDPAGKASIKLMDAPRQPAAVSQWKQADRP